MSRSTFEQIHKVVRCIPRGKVATYGQIARLIGMPRGARTVGWALRATPDGMDLPWQRVVNSQGAISLSSGSPGAVLQRTLLEEEGVVFDAQDRIDLTRFGWPGLDPVELQQLFDNTTAV
jgi:methylated-DNA-protein-cysteine methyltransferase-like protein